MFLADHGDNTGGGAPGDSTEILRTFLELGLQDALLLYMVDPEAAIACAPTGVGGRIHVSLGGKSAPIQGPPVEAEAEVVAISDGRFSYDGPMYGGLTGNMGPSAWLWHRRRLGRRRHGSRTAARSGVRPHAGDRLPADEIRGREVVRAFPFGF